MSARLRDLGRLGRWLLRDERGGMLENISSMSMSWYALFSVFLMNVQLGQGYHQRDMVDHAASVAADTVTKTLCADAEDYGGTPPGEYKGDREKAVNKAVEPLLGLVAPKDACKVKATAAGGGSGGGASAGDGKKEMDVTVSCEIPCSIPLAAQVMCSGSPPHISFEAKQKATATGCDSGK